MTAIRPLRPSHSDPSHRWSTSPSRTTVTSRLSTWSSPTSPPVASCPRGRELLVPGRCHQLLGRTVRGRRQLRCTGTLPALGYDKDPRRRGRRSWPGRTTGTSVTSGDAWYGKTGSNRSSNECPDNTNPGDLSHDGTANADDCGSRQSRLPAHTTSRAVGRRQDPAVVPGMVTKGDFALRPDRADHGGWLL